VKQKQARQPEPASFLPLLLYQNKKSTKKEHTRQFSIFVFQYKNRLDNLNPFHFGLFALVNSYKNQQNRKRFVVVKSVKQSA